MQQQQNLKPAVLASWRDFIAVAALLGRWPVVGVNAAKVESLVSCLGFAGLQSVVDAVWLQRLEDLAVVCAAAFWQALDGPLLEGVEGAEEISAYRDVRAALLLADEHFGVHIGLARMVDVAAARTGATPSRTTVEAAYRESFISRIMSGAPPAFPRKMRLFFQHNIASWGEQWRPGASGQHHKKRQRAEDSEASESGAGSGSGNGSGSGLNTPGATPGGEASAVAAATTTSRGGGGGVAMDDDAGSSGDAIGKEGGPKRRDDELRHLWSILHKQGWMVELRDVFTEALHAQIAAHVRSVCAGRFHTPLLAACVAWKDEVLWQRLGELQADCVPPAGALLFATEAGAFAVATPAAPAAGAAPVAGASSPPPVPVPAAVSPSSKSQGQSNVAMESTLELESMLDLIVHEVFCGARMAEAFDMVAVYPGSDWALQDMQAALAVTGLHWQFAAALRVQVSRRLLHPGADTDDVLEMLVCTVKALLVLDPQGAIAEAVTGLIKRYLQGRSDTVRCVLRALTDGSESDLNNELRRGSGGGGSGSGSGGGSAGGGPPGQVGDGRALGEAAGENEDDPPVPGELWMPAAREGGWGMGGSSGGSSAGKRLAAPLPRRHDMLAMLVGIYGSKGKEVFVKEFRQMMVEWMLENKDYDTTRERRILEELKLRFGEDRMKQCDVMVRDVDDSKRINANVKEHLKHSQPRPEAAGAAAGSGRSISISTPTASPSLVRGSRSGSGSTQLRDLVADTDAAAIDTLLVSQHFWPALPVGEVRVHPRMQAAARRFAEAYEVLKTPRKLAWRPYLGHMELELKLAGSADVTKVTVTPAHAALIMHFEDRSEWTLDELSAQVGSSAGDVQKKMARWVNLGVLREGPVGRYVLVTDTDRSSDAAGSAGASALDRVDFRDDDGGEDGVEDGSGSGSAAGSAAVSARQQLEEAAERYLVGMLGNLGRLPLEKIHNMLKMFMSTGDQRYDLTLAELVVLLRRLCALGRLEQAGAEYRLPPKA